MSSSSLKVVFVLGLIVALSGCSMLFQPDEAKEKLHVQLNPPPKPQEGSFNYSGSVELPGIGDGCVRDIRISMYDANQEIISSYFVGDLCYSNETSQSRDIEINSTIQPKYIVVDSDDFWEESSNFSATGFVRNPDQTFYDSYSIEEPGQIKPTAGNESINRKTVAVNPDEQSRETRSILSLWFGEFTSITEIYIRVLNFEGIPGQPTVHAGERQWGNESD